MKISNMHPSSSAYLGTFLYPTTSGGIQIQSQASRETYYSLSSVSWVFSGVSYQRDVPWMFHQGAIWEASWAMPKPPHLTPLITEEQWLLLDAKASRLIWEGEHRQHTQEVHFIRANSATPIYLLTSLTCEQDPKVPELFHLSTWGRIFYSVFICVCVCAYIYKYICVRFVWVRAFGISMQSENWRHRSKGFSFREPCISSHRQRILVQSDSKAEQLKVSVFECSGTIFPDFMAHLPTKNDPWLCVCLCLCVCVCVYVCVCVCGRELLEICWNKLV